MLVLQIAYHQASVWLPLAVGCAQKLLHIKAVPGFGVVLIAGHSFNGKILWGDWSVESQYVTNGQPAAAAASTAAPAASAAAAGSKKKERKKAPEKKSSAVAPPTAADKEQALEQQKVSFWQDCQ